MQPQLTLKDGTVITLADEVFAVVLSIVQSCEVRVEAAASIESLETEFSDLLTTQGPSTEDLLEEHRRELSREEEELRRLG